jgi:phospholipid/cholesterol/gamma-HCH transport system ATP-binding protein
MAVILEKQRIVLRFENTVLTTDPYGGGGSDELNINVFGGDLFLIRLARLEQTSAFADASAGIFQPMRGTVYFLGRNWEVLSPDHANALRGRIGRVFSEGNWIKHLSLMENILLPQLHHTRRAAGQIRDEAAGLAERFGLPGAPVGLPGNFIGADLQRAACVRAFLGRPSLILLEEPTTGMVSEIASPLIHAIGNARDRGAAVIWLTRENAIWNDSSIPATYRYRLVGRKLMEVTV